MSYSSLALSERGSRGDAFALAHRLEAPLYLPPFRALRALKRNQVMGYVVIAVKRGEVKLEHVELIWERMNTG